MGNEDGSVQVVFNGEIYNFLPLREELIAKGHRFQTRSDTEVLVHLYEEVGENLVDRLRGMFAFAIWDRRRRRLVLARDRVGLKPLYVYRDETRLLFGSEIKAILAHPGVDRTHRYRGPRGIPRAGDGSRRALHLPEDPQVAPGPRPRRRPRRFSTARRDGIGNSTSGPTRTEPSMSGRRPSTRSCSRPSGPTRSPTCPWEPS